ncbi:Antimicrobial peptide NK-lysin [Varanus komodoensis]|nr:Antimicrobial peptide NK-lysin [Varanus komodoensis]
MAALLILYLNFAVGAVLATSEVGPPKPCQQGPAFWCRDAATAVACHKEKYCLAGEWNTLEGLIEGEAEALAPLFKCTICKKIVKKLRDLAGDDPDDEKVDRAIKTLCKVLGKFLQGLCKRFLRLYKAKLVMDLQNGMETDEICVDLKICRPGIQALPGLPHY